MKLWSSNNSFLSSDYDFLMSCVLEESFRLDFSENLLDIVYLYNNLIEWTDR